MVDSKIIEDIFSSSRSKSKESKRPNLSIPSKDEAFNHADTGMISSHINIHYYYWAQLFLF